MDSRFGICAIMRASAEALRAFSFGAGITAHNIANVSTAGFEPERASYADGPSGVGVETRFVSAKERLMGSESTVGVDDKDRIRISGTELAREIPSLISSQRAFEANAQVARAAEEMSGSILDLKT